MRHRGLGPPRDNGHAVALLGHHRVLDESLAAAVRRAVGFRNVLVHEHVEVDDAVVLRRLGDLSDLESFVTAVAQWLPSGPPDL